jgi:hypothetical protein
MAINKIISEKTLNYIETLYLYANLQDFCNINAHTLPKEVYITFMEDAPESTYGNFNSYTEYLQMNQYLYDTLLYNYDVLGYANGRQWYDIGYCRIGIMDYDLAEKTNQFNVEIQYTQAHLFSLGDELKGLKLPLGGTFEQYHIKRIDVTQIVKTPHDYLTNHNFISPYRTIDRHEKSGKTETVYLGNRSSGNVFRMYNKTIELNVDTKVKPMDYNKIELFSSYFGDIENLYTFELELHRKYLKPTFGIDTLKDLKKVYQAQKDIVGKIRIYKDTDANKKLVKTNHRSRIKTLGFMEYKELPRLKKKKYKLSKTYMINKAVTAFNRYEDAVSEPLTLSEKLSIFDEIISKMSNHQDISIELLDSTATIEYDAMKSKIESMRDNQDDQLLRESSSYFSPISLQRPKDLF